MPMFEKALIPVENTAPFEALSVTIARLFSASEVERHLNAVKSKGLKVRNFDGALNSGLLGADAVAQYKALNPAEQGMVREQYLGALEQVDMKLRMKFKNIYGYY